MRKRIGFWFLLLSIGVVLWVYMATPVLPYRKIPLSLVAFFLCMLLWIPYWTITAFIDRHRKTGALLLFFMAVNLFSFTAAVLSGGAWNTGYAVILLFLSYPVFIFAGAFNYMRNRKKGQA